MGYEYETNRRSQKSKDRIQKIGGKKQETVVTRILDLGCSTGSLANSFSEYAKSVIGIDQDLQMISFARDKAKESDKSPRFFQMNMLDLGSLFNTGNFDLVTCYGNTLAHITVVTGIESLLKQVFEVFDADARRCQTDVNGAHILVLLVETKLHLQEPMTVLLCLRDQFL